MESLNVFLKSWSSVAWMRHNLVLAGDAVVGRVQALRVQLRY